MSEGIALKTCQNGILLSYQHQRDGYFIFPQLPNPKHLFPFIYLLLTAVPAHGHLMHAPPAPRLRLARRRKLNPNGQCCRANFICVDLAPIAESFAVVPCSRTSHARSAGSSLVPYPQYNLNTTGNWRILNHIVDLV
jgi:hypothetical protein